MLNRRGFLRSVGPIAALPAIGSGGFYQKDWHCLIGGNRAGKSTRAAEMVKNYKLIVCVATCHRQFNDTQANLLPPQPTECELMRSTEPPSPKGWVHFTSQQSLVCEFFDARKHFGRLFDAYKVTKKDTAIWADECPPDGLDEVADLFDIAVFSSWPAEGIQGSPFYEECLRMGTVQHMRTLPHRGVMGREVGV